LLLGLWSTWSWWRTRSHSTRAPSDESSTTAAPTGTAAVSIEGLLDDNFIQLGVTNRDPDAEFEAHVMSLAWSASPVPSGRLPCVSRLGRLRADGGSTIPSIDSGPIRAVR